MPLDWTEGDLAVDGARLHYYRLGNKGGPPLVLQHGFSDNGLCWLTLAGDLQAQYDIVMPDARGHGRSARVPVAPAPDGNGVDMTAELAGLIRGLGLERPIVAGHSMGAMLASQLGARFPDLPRALILEDPGWWLPQASEVQAPKLGQDHPLAQWIASLEGLSLQTLIERHRTEHPTWSDLVLHRWSEGKQQLDPNVFAAGDLGWGDWREVVPAIACPTLLITADPDKGGIVTPEVARMAAEMNAHITATHVSGTGHHVRFENYNAYRDTVRAFLAELEKEE
jgi:N-formylmaleamate deformylase